MSRVALAIAVTVAEKILEKLVELAIAWAIPGIKKAWGRLARWLRSQ